MNKFTGFISDYKLTMTDSRDWVIADMSRCGGGGQPWAELGDTRGAQHEGVPEQSRGVQEPSHGAHDDGDGILSQLRHVGRLITFQFQSI